MSADIPPPERQITARWRIATAIVVGSCLAAVLQAAEEKTPPIARMVYYSGRVQGVGFRLGTTAIARKYPVTGWVKNLKDGRVQLLVEGQEDQVQKFLKEVREHWKKNIDKEGIEKRESTGKYKTFDVEVD